MEKIKLSTDSQIEHMKNVNGILFTITNEKEAVEFLRNNNYYFKLKAYAKNYDKYIDGNKKGKYINLEFAYLQEISRIDMYLRKFIMQITLDIEHFCKTKLLKDLSENNKEDGFTIVEELLKAYPYIQKSIEDKSKNSGSACKDLIDKFNGNFSAWSIIEVLSFGDFIKLYTLYYKKYPNKDSMVEFLWSVKFLRNAAAHNNCLINSLKYSYSGFHANKKMNTTISKIPTVGATERKKKLCNHVIHDFVVTLYVFCNIVSSQSLKKITLEQLKDMVDTRFSRHKEYFLKNQVITSNYIFIKKIVDYFYDICV